MKSQIDQGNLKGNIFPFLLKDLYLGNYQGMLSLKKNEIRKFLFLDKGSITYVQSSLPEEQLGEIMLRAGIYNQAHYLIIQDLVRQGGWTNSRISNYIDKTTLEWWLQMLVREVVLSLFEWSEGEFRFLHGKKPPKSCFIVDLNIMKLIVECLRRVRNPEILTLWIGSLKGIPTINSSMYTTAGKMMNITPQEGFFLSRIDGSLSFEQILSLAGKQRLEMLQFFVASIFTDLIKSGPPKIVLKSEKPKPVVSEQFPLEPPVKKPSTPQPPPPPPPPEPESKQRRRIVDELDDITLTDEELSDLSKYSGNIKSLLEDWDLGEKVQVGLQDQITYLRDGQFVEGSDQNGGAIDISELKVAEKRPEDEDDERITLIIDGERVDGETDFVDRNLAQDFLTAKDAEEQWRRFMFIDLENEDPEFERRWEQSWKTWEQQQREMEDLRQKRERLMEEIKEKHNSDELAELRRQSFETTVQIEKLIKKKKKEIINAHRRSQFQNYYERLQIPQTASPEAVMESYKYWINQYQPEQLFLDEFGGLSDQFMDLSNRLKEALDTLYDPEKRREYDQELIRQKESAETLKKKKKTLAQNHVVSSRTAMQRGDRMLALQFLRGSISLDPRNPNYFEEMADILGQNQKWWREAMTYYHRAFHLEPENVDRLIKVAALAIKMGMDKFAEKALIQTLKMKPNDSKAKALLATIKK